ncbi:MAG: EAL domain-containing protein [Campylobacterales bacterium]|nr:EAL domain-containing protein [Campylobacterales bacterium]
MSFQSFMKSYMLLGIAQDDSDDEIIKKRMLSFLPLIIGVVATVLGGIYILFGHYLSASIPLFYTVISALNLWHLFTTKKIWFLQISQLLLVLFLPFFLMWSLGGFTGGSFMLIWAFFAPVAAMAFEKNKNTIWFIAFIILIFISSFLDSTLIHEVSHLSQGWITTFFVLNSVVGFGGIYYMFHYYITDKERRSEAVLFKEHQALLKTSNELAQANSRLEQIATHDHLTGLENRFSLLEKLQNAIYYAMNHDQKLALFFIDLDRFKQINDTMGHPVGDQVLIHISNVLRGHVSGNNIVSRLGGDEFVVLVDKFKDIDDLSFLADKLTEAVRQVIQLENQELQVTCSIGISIYPDDLEGNETLLHRENIANLLLRNADTAMYRAKEEGKNNYQYYQMAMTVHAIERMELEKDLRNALKEDQFVVYYQPQIDAELDKIIGMEALVRWNHPLNGFVQPNNFIPLAEEIGLIVLIDRIVMQKAMLQFAQWYAQGLNPGVLSLNLSVRQLEQEDFVSRLQQLIQDTGCQAQWIELEVTEGHIMSNPQKSIMILKVISALGIKISIDDFGTGYSSLAYLKQLPIDKLKIDKSFVDGLPHDENDVAIVKTIIGLTQSLQLSIIAEGVETQEQKRFLVDYGCNLMQGYLYAKPMDAERMKSFLIESMGNLN